MRELGELRLSDGNGNCALNQGALVFEAPEQHAASGQHPDLLKEYPAEMTVLLSPETENAAIVKANDGLLGVETEPVRDRGRWQGAPALCPSYGPPFIGCRTVIDDQSHRGIGR